MRRIFSIFAITLVMLLAISPITASATESEQATAQPISITVVVPRPDYSSQVTTYTSELPIFQPIYPIHVWESREDNRREIVRVYELREGESPAQIPRESFERDGFIFKLAEIVRSEVPIHSMVDHVEVVGISTQTNELKTIINQLSPTLDYMREDGYFGVLTLDISSIRVESQGTRSSNFTATRTREFPHLSNADTSLIPRTITEGGRTYNLANVEWNTQSTSAIDYRQVPSTFTAVATFSRVGTRLSTIGYTTTAEYRGQISRISQGRTEFTAYFIGIPIVTPTVNIDMEQSPLEASPAITLDEPPSIIIQPEIPTEDEIISEYMQAENVPVTSPVISIIIDDEVATVSENEESRSFPIRNIINAVLFIAGIAIAYLMGKKGVSLGVFGRKISCLILISMMLAGTVQTAYATPIPQYSFGVQNSENTIHFNESLPTATHEIYNGNNNNQTAIHFDPRVSGSAPQASNTVIINQNTGFTNAYNYGEVIGVLHVERLGRRVNIIAGATMSAMDFGAGHFSFSGLNYGNTALIGHNRGRTNGFFDFVRHLQEGDILTLEANGITRRYAVTNMFAIDYTDFSPLMQFQDHRLTLVTCWEYRQTQRRVAVAIAID